MIVSKQLNILEFVVIGEVAEKSSSYPNYPTAGTHRKKN